MTFVQTMWLFLWREQMKMCSQENFLMRLPLFVFQGFEAIQQVDNIEVEETCVLVSGNELHFVPFKEHKHRAYKKKVQDAISSRMRSKRKHEYKELAVWYGKVVKSKQECAEMNSIPSHGSCELEWELL